MDKLLTGKTALVTGAAKRIGRAIPLALAENGANVAITYLGSQSESEDTVRALAAFDVDAMAVRCDLRDPLSIEQMVAAVTEEFGQIDLLVNNAGIFESEALENISVEQWDAMFTTNTRAPFLVAKAAYQHRLSGRHSPMGHARPLLHLEGCSTHALTDHGEGLGAGDQCELHCPRHDRSGRGGRGL